MHSQWVIWLLVSGVTYVFGNSCDVQYVESCYSELIHYETISFPLYGADDAQLNDTCGNIDTAFECIKNYAENCLEKVECDDRCLSMIREIHNYLWNNGLSNLAKELCQEHNVVREIYLDNYHCLEKNADAYAGCHNDSQKSQEYLDTINTVDSIPEQCCFFSWQHDCFVNATRDNCAQNATFVVSFGIFKLVGQVADEICKDTNITCDRPPLSPEDEEDELDKHKPDKTEDDLDNSINDDSYSSSSINSCTLCLLVFAYCIVIFSKCIL